MCNAGKLLIQGLTLMPPAGLSVPWGSRLSNVGVGSGGLLDWLGVTRISYAGVAGYYVSQEAAVAAGGWTADKVMEGAKWSWQHRYISTEPIYDRRGGIEDYMVKVGIVIPVGAVQ